MSPLIYTEELTLSFYASWFFALHIYQQSFSYFRMGYGSALAWIFAVIVMALTIANVRLSDRWVYYGGEE